MRVPPRPTLAVACLVVLAGCSLPSGGPASPTASPTPPSTAEPEPFPPGVSADGIENGTALYAAHVDAITAAGYVAVAAVNTTVQRSAFLIDIQSRARIRVEPNASSYHEQRRVVGGPADRHEAFWANGSVEFRRQVGGGEPEYERREPRSPRAIAGRRLLLPLLQGGDYAIESVNETAGTATVVLVADSVADPEAVRRALPSEADSVGAFRARVVVEGERIRSLVADVEFGIEGTNRTHHVEYELVRTDGVSVERPDWVDDAIRSAETGTETDTETETETGAGTETGTGTETETPSAARGRSDLDRRAASRPVFRQDENEQSYAGIWMTSST